MSRDDDVDLAEVPEADAAEQQAPVDPDDLPDAGEELLGQRRPVVRAVRLLAHDHQLAGEPLLAQGTGRGEAGK